MDALAVLQRLGSGHLLEEIHDALIVTAGEVVATGKPGKVTITLAITTRNQGDPLITIDEVVSRTAPKKDARGALLYCLNGDLHREDPRQLPMDFRTVDRETGEIRSVDRKAEERVIS